MRWAGERKPERGYALRLDISQLTPAINSSNRRLRNGKKRDESWKNPKRGAICHSDIYLVQLLVLIGRRRDEQWKRNPAEGNADHSESIPQSTPAINPSDRSARWMSGETKRMCMQLKYPNFSQLFSYWLRRKSDMSDGKEAQMVRTSLEYPEPSQLCDQFLCFAQQTEGYSDIPLVALASRL